MTYLPLSFEGRRPVSSRPSIRLKISPEDRFKLMSLPPAQRREHLRFALLIWANDLLRDPSLTWQDHAVVLRTLARMISK